MSIKRFTTEMAAAFDALNEDQLEFLKDSDVADATCTGGTDNDGSSTYEIFENGFALGVKAIGRLTHVYCREAPKYDNTVFFFVGTPEEVIAKIEKVVEESPADD